jgi:hypothetical protein
MLQSTTAWTVTVLPMIQALDVGGAAVAGAVAAGEYEYYNLTIPGGRPAETDLTLSADSFGPLDIIASIKVARPNLYPPASDASGGAGQVWASPWAAGGAGTLTLTRSELPPLPLDGLRIFAAVRGAGRFGAAVTRYFLSAVVDSTQAVKIGQPVRTTAIPGRTALFKVNFK